MQIILPVKPLNKIHKLVQSVIPNPTQLRARFPHTFSSFSYLTMLHVGGGIDCSALSDDWESESVWSCSTVVHCSRKLATK